MNSTQASESWTELIGLNADTAAEEGWFAESVEHSPALGYRMELRNPKGELVAWGWSPARLDVAGTVKAATLAYGRVMRGDQ